MQIRLLSFSLDIIQAIEKRDVDLLRKAIKLVEKKRYVGRLKNELKEAKKLLISLERIAK